MKTVISPRLYLQATTAGFLVFRPFSIFIIKLSKLFSIKGEIDLYLADIRYLYFGHGPKYRTIFTRIPDYLDLNTRYFYPIIKLNNSIIRWHLSSEYKDSKSPELVGIRCLVQWRSEIWILPDFEW